MGGFDHETIKARRNTVEISLVTREGVERACSLYHISNATSPPSPPPPPPPATKTTIATTITTTRAPPTRNYHDYHHH